MAYIEIVGTEDPGDKFHKFISASKLIELLKELDPEELLVTNQVHNLTIYAPLSDQSNVPEDSVLWYYAGYINLGTEETERIPEEETLSIYPFKKLGKVI